MTIRIVGLIGFACLALFGQPSAASSPEAPQWPGAGSLSKSLEGQYVFVTPERDALMIRVPPNSDYARSGKPGIIRYDLHNRLRPAVAVRLSVTQKVNYVYEYAVDNATPASDSIGTWSLVIPSVDGEKPVMSCGEWCGGLSFAPIIRQVEMPDQPKGRAVMWTRPNGISPIGPSESRRGFRIESSCRPGFTTALFSSGIWVNIDQDLPNEVFKQLEFFNDPTWGNIPVLTFGPMFCAGSSRQAIAGNLISGIKRLLETKRLDPKSEFVRDVLAWLISEPENNPGEAAHVGHSPSGELEAEIAKALELNLSFKIP